jgi:hypothetical protein
MTKKIPFKLVYVVWEDASIITDGQWTSLEDRGYEPKLVTQVGFLVKDQPECIQLTECFMEGPYGGNITQIPRGMIRDFRAISDPTKFTKLKI